VCVGCVAGCGLVLVCVWVSMCMCVGVWWIGVGVWVCGCLPTLLVLSLLFVVAAISCCIRLLVGPLVVGLPSPSPSTSTGSIWLDLTAFNDGTLALCHPDATGEEVRHQREAVVEAAVAAARAWAGSPSRFPSPLRKLLFLQPALDEVVFDSYREVRGVRVCLRRLPLTALPDDVLAAQTSPPLALALLPLDLHTAVHTPPVLANVAWPHLGVSVRVEVSLPADGGVGGTGGGAAGAGGWGGRPAGAGVDEPGGDGPARSGPEGSVVVTVRSLSVGSRVLARACAPACIRCDVMANGAVIGRCVSGCPRAHVLVACP
jgi:hypothetical protein